MLLKVLRLYKTNKEEARSAADTGSFRTNASLYELVPAWWTSGHLDGTLFVLIEIDDLRGVVDPVWDKRASAVEWIGPKRFFESPLPLAELPTIDAVLVPAITTIILGSKLSANSHTLRRSVMRDG